MLKGALHLHTTYSDGEFTLAELREVLRAAGCDFALMTDHAEDFDAAKVKDYVAECAALSDDKFTFIPGLEFECEQRMHILGLGVTELVTTQNPEEVIRHIAAHNGVSVIAHPKNEFFDWIEGFTSLPDGIETWNSKYDSRYAPRPGTFELLQRLQTRKPQMCAFYGIDLHWRHQYRGLFNQVECATTKRDDLFAALNTGRFHGVKENLALPAHGRLSNELVAAFAQAQARSNRMRQTVKSIKQLVKSCGITVPAPVKAQLRRIF